MTKTEIEKLDGLDLRAAVAREVFGCSFAEVELIRQGYQNGRPVEYETNDGFMLVVHEMERRECIWTFRFGGDAFKYSAMFSGKESKADTLPVAVCRAAVKWCREVNK